MTDLQSIESFDCEKNKINIEKAPLLELSKLDFVQINPIVLTNRDRTERELSLVNLNKQSLEMQEEHFRL